MELTTIIKNVRISPKKLRFLLPEVKKLRPKEALVYLLYTPKKGAKVLYQAIKSAINNAKNYLKIEEEKLKFKTIIVDEGLKLKRYHPGGRGTVKPYKKRFSHIKITLIGEEEQIKSLKRENIGDSKLNEEKKIVKKRLSVTRKKVNKK
jgi:large subunit ribosomal protein L22